MLIVPQHTNSKHDGSSVDPRLVEAVGLILAFIEKDGDLTDADRANYSDTRIRAAKALQSLIATRTTIASELSEVLKTGFPRDAHDRDYIPGLVTQGPIVAYSMCPHHLLQVSYKVYVSYIPEATGTVLGLSKLARIVKILARRPVLQEQLASDIADALHWHEGQTLPGIKTTGSAVTLVGKHSCMACRGVQSEAMTAVTELRGAYWQQEMEQKFYKSIDLLKHSGQL